MLALRLYQIMMFLAAPMVRIHLMRRAAKGREDRVRLREKFGRAALKRPPGHLIWIHGASVGEVNSVLPLIEDILRARPAQQVLLTSSTVTSAQIIARWQSCHADLRARLRHQFSPLDRPSYIRRFLNHWRPNAAFWVESEIWPNLVMACAGDDIPLAMINGRLSQRSFAGWQKIGKTAAHLLGQFSLLMAQDDTTAQRLAALGAAGVKTPGNLKLDAPPLDDQAEAHAAIEKSCAGRPLFLAASTHEDEEAQIGEAMSLVRAALPDALAIIVPRHPERGDLIAAQLRAAGHQVAQRSKDALPAPETQIYLADTLGELGVFYRLADIVLMGGTMVPHGGQNPMEAAQLCCAILHGPHIDNFSEIFDALTARQGVASISDAPTLAAQITALLQNPSSVEKMAEAAAAYAADMSGSRARVQALLAPYLVDPTAAIETFAPAEAHDG
jgi:3-deoxy-D-manno-octulosonic-acid transferase